MGVMMFVLVTMGSGRDDWESAIFFHYLMARKETATKGKRTLRERERGVETCTSFFTTKEKNEHRTL